MITMLIIHLIGKVGAGKSFFYEKFLATYPYFDIKKIYETTGIQSNELNQMGDYHEFNYKIQLELSVKLELAQKHDQTLIIESSGMNIYLNDLISRIKNRDLYIIWVDCEIADHIYTERPYAERINKLFQAKIVNNNLPFHTKFDWDVKYFTVTPPEHVLALHPELKKCVL